MTSSCTFELEPLDKSTIVKNDSLKNLVYANQDFYSIKNRLRNFIKEEFADEFTDFIESSLAFLLIEPQAFMFDTLSFKLDQIANDIFIDTVTEPDNAFRLAKLVGFTPTAPIPCKALFVATINTVLPGDLIIPGGISVETAANNTTITYELFPSDENNEPIFNQDIVITSGSTSNNSIVGLEGRTYTDTFSGDGTISQTLTLAKSPVIFDSINVLIDGTMWTKVDYFTDSKERQEYRVEFDSSYNAYIIFGNSKSGLIPQVGSSIIVSYRVGGGTNGSIITGAISTYRSFTLDGFNIESAVNFTNYTKGDFGYNGDTINDIRAKLPAYLKTQDRIVSDTDYKSFADLFATAYNGQIGKSVAVLRNHGCAANIVDLYILAKSGENGLEEANDQLKDALNTAIDEKKMIGIFVCLRDGVVIDTDVSLDLVVDKSYRKFKDDIQNRITQRLNSFFLLSNWEFGQSLKSTDLIKALSDIQEITTFNITFTTSDAGNSGELVTTKYYEIIRPDTTTISFVFE